MDTGDTVFFDFAYSAIMHLTQDPIPIASPSPSLCSLLTLLYSPPVAIPSLPAFLSSPPELDHRFPKDFRKLGHPGVFAASFLSLPPLFSSQAIDFPLLLKVLALWCTLFLSYFHRSLLFSDCRTTKGRCYMSERILRGEQRKDDMTEKVRYLRNRQINT